MNENMYWVTESKLKELTAWKTIVQKLQEHRKNLLLLRRRMGELKSNTIYLEPELQAIEDILGESL